MASEETVEWEFGEQFAPAAFDWKPQPAIKGVKAAVREIKKSGRKEPTLAAQGSVLLIEKMSQALCNVDLESGKLEQTLADAFGALATIIATADVSQEIRQAWLERMYDAYCSDEMGLMDGLGEHWGTLCGTQEIASNWAQRLVGECRLAWGPERGRGYFYKGMPVCLSSLLFAERYQDLLELLELATHKSWTYHHYGVRALAGMGKMSDALTYATKAGENTNPVVVAKLCEQILMSAGMDDEAYREYGLLANKSNTYQSWYRSVVSKYSSKTDKEVLSDLVIQTPGDEGKWFAAAKGAGLYDEALALIASSPCSPETLVRASRDYVESRPDFAIESGMAALHWLSKGHGYDKTEALVYDAYEHILEAAVYQGTQMQVMSRIRELMNGEMFDDRFVNSVLAHMLDLTENAETVQQ